MSNIVDLKARRDAATTSTASADVRALLALRDLCTDAIAAGGLDAGGPTTADLSVAVHAALKGTDWKVRFHRERPESASTGSKARRGGAPSTPTSAGLDAG